MRILHCCVMLIIPLLERSQGLSKVGFGGWYMVFFSNDIALVHNTGCLAFTRKGAVFFEFGLAIAASFCFDLGLKDVSVMPINMGLQVLACAVRHFQRISVEFLVQRM